VVISKGVLADILRHGDQRRHATTLLVLATHQSTGALGRDQHHVQVLARLDLLEMDVEAMGKQQRGALGKLVLEFRVQGLLRGIGHQHGHQRGACNGVGRRLDLQTIALGLVPAVTLAHADDDVEPAILQVQRMGAALTSIAQNGDARIAQGLLVDILRSE
jgi:hypothetical protein